MDCGRAAGASLPGRGDCGTIGERTLPDRLAAVNRFAP